MNGILQKINETVAATARRSSFAYGGGSSSSTSSSTGFYISPPSSVNGYSSTPSGSSSSSSTSSAAAAAAAAAGLSPSPTIIYPCSVRRIEFTVPNTWMFAATGNGNVSAATSSTSSTPDTARTTPAGGYWTRRQPSPTVRETGSRSPTVTTTMTRSTPSRSTSSNGGSRLYHLGDGQTAVVDNSSQRTRDFCIPIDYRGGGRSLGTIDPRLYTVSTDDIDDDYEIPDNHIGRIWFSVKYESQTEKLLVTLVKARNLSSSRMVTGLTGGTSGAVGDHFIRLYLLPDERRYLQSKFKKKTSNPQFDEQFVFQISSKDVESRVLKLTVYEVDRLKRHVTVGHALYSLRDYGYAIGGPMDGENGSASAVPSTRTTLIWRDLEREVTEATSSDHGELQISLCYKRQLERLTVGIIEGKNFKKIDSYALPDVYTRVCLQQHSKAVKTKKTEVVRRSVNPSFNESFTFRVTQSDLDMSSIIVTVLQRHNSLQRDHVLGRVVLGSFMFSRGKELEHWNRMTSDDEDHVTLWHSLL